MCFVSQADLSLFGYVTKQTPRVELYYFFHTYNSFDL